MNIFLVSVYKILYILKFELADLHTYNIFLFVCLVFGVKNTKTENFPGYTFPNASQIDDAVDAGNKIHLSKGFFNFTKSNASKIYQLFLIYMCMFINN